MEENVDPAVLCNSIESSIVAYLQQRWGRRKVHIQKFGGPYVVYDMGAVVPRLSNNKYFTPRTVILMNSGTRLYTWTITSKPYVCVRLTQTQEWTVVIEFDGNPAGLTMATSIAQWLSIRSVFPTIAVANPTHPTQSPIVIARELVPDGDDCE
jgi:hypothetical protein